ncbi:hypothetical protein SAMN05216167_12365 [Spirosoma endophyticum]|uniref:Uncharacterized protein n=1 Tax=Spirosoma endophyticum TaxID=662367 RepID=A0A1I2EVX5_9BACT|nr:hypothetical protein SAMN05216167_12365 [Spirosoma endophyticum]
MPNLIASESNKSTFTKGSATTTSRRPRPAVQEGVEPGRLSDSCLDDETYDTFVSDTVNDKLIRWKSDQRVDSFQTTSRTNGHPVTPYFLALSWSIPRKMKAANDSYLSSELTSKINTIMVPMIKTARSSLGDLLMNDFFWVYTSTPVLCSVYWSIRRF